MPTALKLKKAHQALNAHIVEVEQEEACLQAEEEARVVTEKARREEEE